MKNDFEGYADNEEIVIIWMNVMKMILHFIFVMIHVH